MVIVEQLTMPLHVNLFLLLIIKRNVFSPTDVLCAQSHALRDVLRKKVLENIELIFKIPFTNKSSQCFV